MKTHHTYTPSNDYINQLRFDYIETYSFQRGTDYEENLKMLRKEYSILKVRKEKRNNLTESEELRFIELGELSGYAQYLVNEKGQFHSSSEKINTFQYNDPIVQRLIAILKTDIVDIPRFMCAPTYRDAIVFYTSAQEIISVLNVCLECLFMETQQFAHINADFETYDLLKKYFIDIGHKVENPTNFIMDEIKQLQAKHGKSTI